MPPRSFWIHSVLIEKEGRENLKGNKYKREGKIKERKRTRNIYKVINKKQQVPRGVLGLASREIERERCIHVAGSLGKATAVCVAKVCVYLCRYLSTCVCVTS